ncbi:MAG: TetR/AcrR family transcriptional regulator [Phycisphaerae bacterium]|jgi:AcrR family transcriptional regulator
MPPSRRDELVDAAMRVFYRHGFHASGLDRILEESGISRMTIYNHFKSKDELILAALRRRDEIFRNKMMQFVDAKKRSPISRLLAVFDYHENWFTGKDFCGCMFINASAEFSDPASAPCLVAAEHKRSVVRYLVDLAKQAGLADPQAVADQLNILIEGSIVTAQVVGQVEDNDPGAPARLAKQMAACVLDRATKA